MGRFSIWRCSTVCELSERVTSTGEVSVVTVTVWVCVPNWSVTLAVACSPTVSWTEGLRSEEHTSELQSHLNLVCRLLLEKKKKTRPHNRGYTVRWNIITLHVSELSA